MIRSNIIITSSIPLSLGTTSTTATTSDFGNVSGKPTLPSTTITSMENTILSSTPSCNQAPPPLSQGKDTSSTMASSGRDNTIALTDDEQSSSQRAKDKTTIRNPCIRSTDNVTFTNNSTLMYATETTASISRTNI